MTVKSNGHFDKQASLWERKFEPNGSMSQRPAAFVKQLRRNLGNSGSVLDFGCGSADITIACQACGFQMCGIDCSEGMIERARRRPYACGIAFTLLDSTVPLELPYPAAQFDAIIASSVFEYLCDPLDYFREFARISVPGGFLILTVPNLLHPYRWLESVLRPFLSPAHFKNGGRLQLYAEYLSFSKIRFRLKDWICLLKEAGWELESVNAKHASLLMLVAKKICLSPRPGANTKRDSNVTGRILIASNAG